MIFMGVTQVVEISRLSAGVRRNVTDVSSMLVLSAQ